MSRKKIDCLRPTFIEHFPDQLEPGVLYVSMKYAMCAHSCVCGCGQKVITPLSPKKWKIIYDGESVTLYPSIGNYGFPCHSHYFITNGRIDWVDADIDNGTTQKNKKKSHKRLRWSIRKKKGRISKK